MTGGAIGIALSSNLEKAQDIHRILIFLQKAMAASCLGALMTVAGATRKGGFMKESRPGLPFSGLLLQLLQMESSYALTTLTLTLTWGGIIVLCMGLAATTGLIQRLDAQAELRRIPQQLRVQYGMGDHQGSSATTQWRMRRCVAWGRALSRAPTILSATHWDPFCHKWLFGCFTHFALV